MCTAESSRVFKVIYHFDNALITKRDNRIGDTGSSDRHNFGLLIAHLELVDIDKFFFTINTDFLFIYIVFLMFKRHISYTIR